MNIQVPPPGKTWLPHDPQLEDFTPRDIIEILRDIPTECDYCHAHLSADELEPLSGGQWACWSCIERWEKILSE